MACWIEEMIAIIMYNRAIIIKVRNIQLKNNDRINPIIIERVKMPVIECLKVKVYGARYHI